MESIEWEDDEDRNSFLPLMGCSDILSKLRKDSVLWLDMSDGVGNPTDKSTFSNVYTKNDPTWVTGSNALSFDGVDDYVSGAVGDISDVSMGLKDCSVILSILFDGAPVVLETLIRAGATMTGVTQRAGYVLFRNVADANTIRVRFCDSTGVNLGVFIATSTINDTKFHLIIVEFDRDGLVRLWSDNNVSADTVDISTEQGSITNYTQIFLGSYSAASNFFTGDISFFGQLNRLLSVSEKNQLYRKFKSQGRAQ